VNGAPNPTLETGYRELMINSMFFDSNGGITEAYRNHPGIEYLCRMLESVEEKHDLWLIMELCG
jgi:hypothetical protein